MKSILLTVLIFAPSLSFYDEVETKPATLDNSAYIINNELCNHEERECESVSGSTLAEKFNG